MKALLSLGLFFSLFSGPAFAERHYADHGCNVILRHAWYQSGGRAGWSFVIDIRESFLRSHPVQSAGVIWRLQGGAWSYLPLSRYNHPHRIPGFQSYVGYFDHAGHSSMYLDAVAVASTGEDRVFDHNFESGDTGFVRADSSNRWDVSPGATICRR